MNTTQSVLRIFDKTSLFVVALVTLPLALAPFSPPHLIEKMALMSTGDLVDPMDVMDLILHSIPFVIFVFKLVRTYGNKSVIDRSKLE